MLQVADSWLPARLTRRVKDPGGSGKMIEDYWGSAQKLLADPKFVQTLKEYDKDSVPPKIIERIRRDFTSNPEFTPANAAKASRCVSPVVPD